MTLKEQLEALVPEPTADFTTGARAYATKTKRRRVGGLVAGAALLAVGVVPLVGGEDDRPEVATPARELACESHLPPLDQPPPLPGPERALLCSDSGAPKDALETDVAELVEIALTAPPYEQRCIDTIGDPGWYVVFGYADGSTRTVGGFSTCGFMHVGSNTLADSGEFQREFRTRLALQRSGRQPPNLEEQVACEGGGPNSPLIGQLAMTAARLCVWDESSIEARPLTASELQAVNADFAAHAVPMGSIPTCLADMAAIGIVGTNAWGDRIVMHRTCGGFLAGEQIWEPSAATKALLGLE